MSPPNTRSRGKSVSKSSSKTGSSRCFSEFGRLFSELEFRISRQRMREKCRFPLRTPNFWFRKSRQKTIFFSILKIITVFIRKKKLGSTKFAVSREDLRFRLSNRLRSSVERNFKLWKKVPKLSKTRRRRNSRA